MFTILLVTLLLLTVTSLIHYECLSGLNAHLPALKMPSRTKLLVVIFTTFIAHVAEMVVYGVAIFMLASSGIGGGLRGSDASSLLDCIYFSAETYTSLGFGDVSPFGALRLLVAAEALNGLLLIGWSASYAYIAMERYWVPTRTNRAP